MCDLCGEERGTSDPLCFVIVCDSVSPLSSSHNGSQPGDILQERAEGVMSLRTGLV